MNEVGTGLYFHGVGKAQQKRRIVLLLRLGKRVVSREFGTGSLNKTSDE